MLSRRYLRVKVMQALYAFFQSKNDDLQVGERQLLRSLEKLYELYIYQLSLLVEIVHHAKKRLEEAKHKHIPTQEELAPNMRFINNRFIQQIISNKDFIKKCDEYKISWAGEEDMILKTFNHIRQSKEYLAYMQSSEDTYKGDKDIVSSLFENYIIESDLIHHYFGEKSIYWIDDYYSASALVMNLINMYDKDWNADHALPSLYKNEVEDKLFITELFKKAVLHSEENTKIIADKAKNWELERIAIMDSILIQMAICELLYCPSIPVKVTMNEYIDIAKMYSTPKSNVFVNGIMDKLVKEFKENDQLKKIGRGLIEE